LLFVNDATSFTLITFTPLLLLEHISSLIVSNQSHKWEHVPGVWVWNPRFTGKMSFQSNVMGMLTSFVGGKQPYIAPVGGLAQGCSLVYPRPRKFTTMTEQKTEVINPTEKPYELLAHLISRFSKTGDTVLDLCSGSGSAAEAAIRLGRNIVSIEIDPRQYRGIIQRLRTLDESETDGIDPGKDNLAEKPGIPDSALQVPTITQFTHCIVCAELVLATATEEEASEGCFVCTGVLHVKCAMNPKAEKKVYSKECEEKSQR
jgi:hypothetical protein